jgi:prepilin-type N-terminal cleavage/methylation domain-containing protein
MNRKAVTLIELIIVVLIIGALTYAAVPRLQFGALYRKQAHGVAKKIVTDLRRARTMAISNAASNPSGYKLRMAGSAPYHSYEIINNATSQVVDSLTIESEISCTGTNEFSFGPLGNLISTGGTTLTVSADGKSFTITVITATGIVKCSS